MQVKVQSLKLFVTTGHKVSSELSKVSCDASYYLFSINNNR